MNDDGIIIKFYMMGFNDSLNGDEVANDYHTFNKLTYRKAYYLGHGHGMSGLDVIPNEEILHIIKR